MEQVILKVNEIIQWVIANKEQVIGGYFALVGVASWIVKLTPTLKDDDVLKGLIRFLGKYVAVNRSSGDGK